jgi:hypothetical protein
MNISLLEKVITLPDDTDTECIALCNAINRFYPALYTIESCCGHGKWPFRIWFRVNDIERLPGLLYWFDICHCGFGYWKIVVYTDCGMSPATFEIVGPSGEMAYKEANEIAKLIEEHLQE